MERRVGNRVERGAPGKRSRGIALRLCDGRGTMGGFAWCGPGRTIMALVVIHIASMSPLNPGHICNDSLVAHLSRAKSKDVGAGHMSIIMQYVTCGNLTGVRWL